MYLKKKDYPSWRYFCTRKWFVMCQFIACQPLLEPPHVWHCDWLQRKLKCIIFLRACNQANIQSLPERKAVNEPYFKTSVHKETASYRVEPGGWALKVCLIIDELQVINISQNDKLKRELCHLIHNSSYMSIWAQWHVSRGYTVTVTIWTFSG